MRNTLLAWLATSAASIGMAVSVGCTVTVPPHQADAFVEPIDAGRDSAPYDSGPPDAASYDVPPADNTCASVHLDTMRIIPRVILVIDQSGSMGTYHFGVPTRWQALEDALVGTDGLVTLLNADARFGAVMYTDGPDDPACPEVVTQSVAMPGLAGIRSMYSTQSPEGNTPTGDTIAYVLTNRATLFDEPASTGPEIMILATDGEPGTCADGADEIGGRALSVSATTDAHAAGINTYVVSVGTDVANVHLQDVANAGVGHTTGPNAPYWVATDTTELHDALNAIATSAIPCTLELVGMIDPLRACEGTVTLGSETLVCGTDWQALDATHIGLSDAACTRLRASTSNLVGTFPCDVIVF